LKKLILNSFFLFLFVFGFSQTKEIDSLKTILLNSNYSDSSKVDIYLALAKEYVPINIDSSYKFSKISLKKAIKANNYGVVMAYFNLGSALDIQLKSDSARFYYDKALSILDKKDNKIERSIIYANYSLSYQNSNRMDLALDFNRKAIELAKNNHNEICRLYFNHSMLYFRSEIPEIGKKYLKLAYNSSVKAKNLRVEGAVIHAISYTYILEKKLDSARIYLEKGMGLCERTKSPETCFRINSALGDLYMKMELYSEAYKAIIEAKKYAVLRNKTDDILSSLVQLGEIENNRENFDKSAEYFNEFETLYRLQKDDKAIVGIDAYKIWSNTEFKRSNYKKSYLLLKNYIEKPKKKIKKLQNSN